MSEQQNPLERAVDLFVFAPVGVAMFAKDTVPTFLKMFVSRGQTEISRQKKSLHDHAHQYRTVGRFAVKYGGPVVKRQAEEKIDGARRLAEETFTGLVVARGGGESDAKPAPAPSTATASRPKTAKVDRGAGATNGSTNGKATKAKPAATKAADTKAADTKAAAARAAEAAAVALPIPGYDQLSASQVVERLDGLSAGELDAVRAYELAHRGRNTILGKITQLTS